MWGLYCYTYGCMQGQINPKIVGATIVGFALVAGAFTVSSLSKPQAVTSPAAVPAAVPERVAIAVTDNNNNGIEDWRDEFVTTKPIVTDQISVDYTPPQTLTGQMSIGFMENIIRAKNYGPFTKTQDEVIANTIDYLAKETTIDLYDTSDIDIMTKWNDQDILNYANTVAATLYRHQAPDINESEINILHDLVTNGNKERIADLEKLQEAYRGYRDDTLLIPVPAFLAKEHLDLINSYNAIFEDIKAMTLVYDDPAVALLRLKRYQDDAGALAYSLQNMYLALEPHAALVSPDDPALLFVVFSPNYQI